MLDVGQALSRALLDVPASLRAASVEEYFSDLLDSADGSPVCLDRLEILFDFVDHLFVMHLGGVLAQGSPAEIAANAQVREVYFGE